MLVEYKAIYQSPTSEGRRRWFSDRTDMDLVVWYSREGRLRGFQFCYGKKRAPRALTWQFDSGFAHNEIVDDRGMMVVASPILGKPIKSPIEPLIEKLTAAADSLEPALRRFVVKKLQEYSRKAA